MTYKFKTLVSIAIASTLFTGCSDETEMPLNPEVPVAQAPGNQTIIYEANPRFYAEDNCLNALSNKLESLKEMGVNVLWVMPINAMGEKNAIGSPYCVKDFKAINAKYGTVADMKALVDKAHSMGIDVILDWVANHTSWDNVWITEHKDWYTQDPEGNIISPEGMGWEDVADLNFDNADMRAAMIDAMVYWVKATGIDGFRCDHTDGVPHDFWIEAINQLRQINADLLMLAESSDVEFFNDGFDMIYGWNYASKLQDLFKGKIKPEALYSESSKELKDIPEGKKVLRYAINHDVAAENSISSLYGNDNALSAAYALTAMLDGVLMLYSSQESDYSGTLSFFDYNLLLWNEDKIEEYKAINNAYTATTAVRGGALHTYQTGKVATFARVSGENALLVMVNTSDSEISVKVPISYAGTTMTNMLSGTSQQLPVTIDLAPYQYCFFYK